MNYWQIPDDPSRTAPEELSWEPEVTTQLARLWLIEQKRRELRQAVFHGLYAVIQAPHLDLSGFATDLINDSNFESVAVMLAERQTEGFNVRFERRRRV